MIKKDLPYGKTDVDPQTDPSVVTAADGTSSGPTAPELSKKADKLREDRPGKAKAMVTCYSVAPITQADGSTAEPGDLVDVSRDFYRQFKGQYVLSPEDYEHEERKKRGETDV